MKNSTMLFLSTVAMIGSVSVVKTEFSPEEMIKLEQFAQEKVKNAIDYCDENEEYEPLCFNDSNYSKNANLFLFAMQCMTPPQVVTLIDSCIDPANKKAEITNCINCKYFANDLRDMKSHCIQAINAGRSSLPMHRVIALNETERGMPEAKYGNLTIAQFIETEKNNLTSDQLAEAQQELAELQKTGQDNLTIYESMGLKYENELRQKLGLSQDSK